MTWTDTKPCAGCGKPTTGMCWTDCGMSLCGAPLCGDCSHVDEKYGWRHEPKEQKPLLIGDVLSSQPDMTAATVVLSPEALAALPEVQALIRQAVEQEREACAKAAHDWQNETGTDIAAAARICPQIAAAIRARGDA